VFLPNFSTESGAIVRALPREGDRDRPADAGIGAGDQRRLAFELAAAAIGLLAVIGLRIERFRPAGRLLLLRWLRRLWSGFSRVVVAHGGMVPWLRCLPSNRSRRRRVPAQLTPIILT
jgi:hypothetical protein